jgi:ubiquinone/menaquinone biosynthesis C-methylase UbiE
MDRERNRVCPVELANSLDSKIRKWFQDPRKILAPYVKEGMTVLDIGCGPGFFSIELAKIVGINGKVISADLQEGMLQKLSDKIHGTDLEKRIVLVKSEKDKINVPERIDFALVFYMVHEVPDKENFFRELKSILNDNGKILIVEPKLFHVSKKDFELTVDQARSAGFTINQGRRLPLSWSAILGKA